MTVLLKCRFRLLFRKNIPNGLNFALFAAEAKFSVLFALTKNEVSSGYTVTPSQSMSHT